MRTAFDVAAHITERCGSVDSIKLQKLVYYSQAWNLVAADEPLFTEPVSAYRKGPVVGLLWKAFEGAWWISNKDVHEARTTHPLRVDEAAVVDAVVDAYGSMSSEELSQLSHDERPWAEAWERSQAGGSNRISADSMKSFYMVQLVSGKASPAPDLPALNVTYVDSERLDEIVLEDDEPEDIARFLAAFVPPHSHAL